jgi:hypothetical protein
MDNEEFVLLRLRGSGARVFCSIIPFAGLGLAQQRQRGMGGVASE